MLELDEKTIDGVSDIREGNSNEVSCIEELKLYRKQEILPLKVKGGDGYSNPLLWWKNRAETFPRLSKLARYYLAIQATSAPSERVFSLANMIISRLRTRLDPETAGALVFLNGTKEWSDREEV